MAINTVSQNRQQQSNIKKKVVFIIEDDLFLAKVTRAELEREGVEVWVSPEGKEALSFLEKQPPNVILLDLMLPGISGFDILAAIRKNEQWKEVPVIVLSNLGQSEDIERCKALGIQEYLVKANVRISDVVKVIKRYLSQV